MSTSALSRPSARPAARESSGAPLAPPAAGLRTLLVASDGSAHSERAFEVAVHLATALRARLDIVSVLESYPEYDFGSLVGAPPPIPDEEGRQHVRQLVTRLTKRAESEGAAPVTGEVLEGHPAGLILAAVKAARADLVVLGARGVSAAHRVFLGSVSNAVATGATRSVLVVRGEPAPPAVFDRVVVALDGSAPATFALDRGAEIARALGRRLRLVTVLPPAGASRRATSEATRRAQGRAILDRARAEAARWGPQEVEAEVLTGAPAEAILDDLGEGTSDLLVVGSRGRSPVRSALLGSVSTALLHHFPGPILIARAPRTVGVSGRRGPR